MQALVAGEIREETMTDKPARDSSMRILELFEEGRKFTEDLLRENERLRAANAQARAELRDLQRSEERRVGKECYGRC